ncbi:hypothetical protein GQR42_16040 [Microcystis aeruginosa FD4]|jgi:transposase|uniref:Transposase IS204/IS1001/IS1096/IS1165 zinc-finger domain-containing protein n=1 Tax=Microcystis aeruginosa FD4 TaxID=2686288 RepID=A0A857D6K6_MICAE|nr:hypothetical protein GQR42_16040 [Microcystis aeruginosa FD4]
MWINFDQLLDLPNVTVVNYQKIAQTIFLKLALLNETIECPNCHETLGRINQTEYNLVRDLSILGNRVYLKVPRRQFHCQKCQKYISERLSFMRLRQPQTIRYESIIYERVKNWALLNQGMNGNCASYPKVSLSLVFKNTTKEDSYLKSATPKSELEHLDCSKAITV